MKRQRLVYALIIGFMGAGVAYALHGENNHGTVKVLVSQGIEETINGKESTATAAEVTLAPGQVGDPHRHPGPAFGYVLEGEYEWAINDEPSKVLKVGDTFYEPAGCLHRVSKNPGKVKTRILAWVLHPRDVKDIVLPASE